ncbi:CSC1-like protein 2 [Saccostrea echinata]|uniref:CSC1-like protein 2 n=1 Tax=Saccostrea echinata TaxID=191078 RepID=UPI002A82C395|nr:CSC1-like protein 2 [Saccostrea echinata]
MSVRHSLIRLWPSCRGAITLTRQHLQRPALPCTGPQQSGIHFSNGQMLPAVCFRVYCSNSVSSEKNKEIKVLAEEVGQKVKITWKNGTESMFHSIWLRNNCHCSECKQDHSGQKLIDVGQIRYDTTVKKVTDSGDDKLRILWSDEHRGEVPLDFLIEHGYSDLTNDFRPSSMVSKPKSYPTLDFSKVVSGQQGVLQWLRDLNEYGVCLLKNVPLEEGMVCKVAELIAPVQQTIYGIQFDVVSKPSPINVAYSSVGLDFHMDLIYYESAPGLQLLHCMKFDECVEGGQSILLDLFYVAEVFRKSNPDEFQTLTRIPTTFQKIHYQRDNPVHMVYQKPIISLNHREEITSISWAPAFEGPLSVRPGDVEPYYRAYHKFAEAIKNSSAKLEFKMVPGDLLSFNNRRVLHGRNAFTLNGGGRHLQGCYVNIDEYKSKLHVLSHLLKDKRMIKQVGNQCCMTVGVGALKNSRVKVTQTGFVVSYELHPAVCVTWTGFVVSVSRTGLVVLHLSHEPDLLECEDLVKMSEPDLTCDTFMVKNHTQIDFTNGEYGGIPFNLIINSVGWLLLILLFTVLRKVAWDYGRIALVSRTEENENLTSNSQYNVWTSLFYGDHDDDDKNKIQGSVESLDAHLHKHDSNMCSWIPAYFRVKDSDILKKSGQDAIQYLSFQRYLIIYTTIVMVLSVVIIVPVNFSGNNIGNETDFGHTTIGNLDPDSPLLWVHAVLAVAFLILLVGLMRHFRVNLQYQEDEQVSRTLMISGIPTNQCYKNQITQHFEEAYPEASVVDVQFAYNIAELVKLDENRRVAEEALKNSKIEYEKTGIRPTMTPVTCGQCCCCCAACGCKEVDAIEHYESVAKKYREKCEKEKVTAYQDPAGIAFVTFYTDLMAARVRSDFEDTCKGSSNPQNSSLNQKLGVWNWSVHYAPSPENIYWENISKSKWKWWMTAIIVNVILVVILFFFTTPLIIINTLNQLEYLKPLEEHSPLLIQFLPTLLLWTFSALLPNVVYYSDSTFIGHWTRTAEHHAIMVKSFIFLILMVLILPSLGLTSTKALIQWFVLDRDSNFRWKCIFLAGHGAFFVNYVITAAFIGTALELIRFSELFMYGLKLLLAHSAAEKTAVRKSVLWEFQYGIQYAWMLCVFAVLMAYSLLCPLVVPFGWVYMILKHAVDRYNIYFAYKPSKINKNIHHTAINFVIIATILLQFNVVFFTALRSEAVNPVFVFSSVALFFSIVMFVGRAFFGWFKNLSSATRKYMKDQPKESNDRSQNPPSVDSPDHFVEQEQGASTPDSTDKPFVAGVLLDNNAPPSENGASRLAASYGTMSGTTPVNQENEEVDTNDVHYVQ